jgi:transcriptional accessory protein Tex/SPT6
MESSPSTPPASPSLDLSRIAQDLQIRRVQVEQVVQLLDEGNTVPFIARYRRERTGGLPEPIVQRIRSRVGQLKHFAERKQTILKAIEAQGKLTDELRDALVAADHPKRLEDLYLPFKPKRKTTAGAARERGLEPAALAIWNRDAAVGVLDEVLTGLVNPDKQLTTVDEVTSGIRQILAEVIAEQASVRGSLRAILWDTGKLTCGKADNIPEGRGQEYKDYFQFTEPIRIIPPHRILAINRGEKEGALKVKLEFDAERARRVAEEQLPLADHPHRDFLMPVLADALDRLVIPSLEREIRRDLSERAQDHAVGVFARNLRSLLLQPPLRNRRVLAIDPGFRTGCRLAALDEAGQLLEDALIHPHHPQNKMAEAKVCLESLIRRHRIGVVAIGNGAACRDTEEMLANLIAELDARRRGEATPALTPPVAPTETPVSGEPESTPAPADAAPDSQPSPAATAPEAPKVEHETGAPTAESVPSVEATDAPATDSVPPSAETATPPPVIDKPPPLPVVVDPSLPEAPADLAFVVVNEAGASDYAVSPIGREELPTLDASLRGTMSIGRRLQDPLGELVKIEPQHVGVGLYQHDVPARFLRDSLHEVVESCVNHVGVDVNTAGVPLLRYVAGLNQYVARDIVDYRIRNGPFRQREQLKAVPSVGESRYTQAAGFLKINGGDEPLDATWIHPESHPLARQLLSELGFEPAVLAEVKGNHPIHEKMDARPLEQFAEALHLSPGSTRDLLEWLARPGHDPRDDVQPPIFKTRVLKLEDMKAGMELKGTVLNVVDFGAFVDVGLKDSGLVHISQMANRYIKNPHEVIAVGDVVSVWVMAVDSDRKRVSLTMIAPGVERRPPERRPPDTSRPAADDRGARGPHPGQRGQRPPRGGQRRPQHAEPRQPESTPPPRTPRQLPPRKPKPLPTLTQAKKEGKAYLNTLGELEAFFKAREQPAPPPAVEEPSATQETVPPSPPADSPAPPSAP